MNFIQKLAMGALACIGVARATQINSVQAIREGVDGAYFNQARVAVYSDGSVTAKAGMKIPAGQFNVNVLGVYTGKPGLNVAVLGDRFGVEGTLTSGKKTGTIEGTIAGCMGQGTLTSTDDGLSQTARISRAEQHGPITAQLGASVTRTPDNAYKVGGDIYVLYNNQIGKVGLSPYVLASLRNDLTGSKVFGVYITPTENKLSAKPTISNPGSFTDIKDYTFGLELRARLN